MNKINNIPKRRFPQFTDAWEQRKLGDIGADFIGGGTPNTGNESFWNGQIPWVQSSDIKEDHVLDITPKKFVSEQGLQKSAAKLIPKNSIAIVTRVGVGKVSLVPFDYATSQDFLSISNLKIDELFATYGTYRLLKSESKKVQGTSIKGITKADLLQKTIKIPTNRAEQTAIGDFFRRLDGLITLHQRKLEHTQTLKKGLLQKMFPQNGQNIPEIRFPQFTDAWELHKLGEISEKVKEKNKNREFTETLTNSAEFGVISQRDFFDKEISNIDNIDNYYIVQNDDFIYNPRISNLAPVGPIKRNKLGRTGVMSPLYYIFRLNSDVEPSYLESYFETKIWHNFMYLNGDTGARSDRFAIKDSIFVQMPIMLPSIAEQTAIGDFFRRLDGLITLHQRKLEHLKQLKKSLLQQMFV
ncbi:restriction endonuclease subunit S [Neisseria yangbaofengii]|uniref:restriction endonuclease subunit S n=2 Tax=Neisseria yangbaofengii TaxID=2709396 RepID=UPI0013EDFF81|nr:restriction endonuclease subunit S [Neisseria yangbaofengii]